MSAETLFEQRKSLISLVGTQSVYDLLNGLYQLKPYVCYILDHNGSIVVTTPNAPTFSIKECVLEEINVHGCLPFTLAVVIEDDKTKRVLLPHLVEILRLKVCQCVPDLQPMPWLNNAALSLSEVLGALPTAMCWVNAQTDSIEYVNPAFEQMFGYVLGEIPDIDLWQKTCRPQAGGRKTALSLWHGQHMTIRPVDGFEACELNVTCKNGDKRHVMRYSTQVGNYRLLNYSDMTDYWHVQHRLTVHGDMLKMVATGQPLESVLKAVVEQVQSESPDAVCSVLLMDENNRLHSCVAPDLPAFYIDAIDGVEIGLGVGSCGTAAFLKERVIVDDISQHPYWRNFTELADSANLRACWSDPIISSSGKVLGTFAIYYPYPASPSSEDIELIMFASNLACVAIEHRQAQQELENRAYFDHLTQLANRGYFFESANRLLQNLPVKGGFYCMVMLDVDHFKRINDQYGHKIGDEVLKSIASAMRAVVQSGEIVGRIGGEEFAVMLPNRAIDEAVIVAERLRRTIEEHHVTIAPGLEVQVTVSVGVAQCCENGEAPLNLDRLFGRVDEALYRAKALGRNRVERYQKPPK